MYNRQKVIDYAKKYVFNYNPNYYNFSNIGGDCTNFVSQCVLAGDKNMDYSQNGWFYNNLNSRSPAWTSVEDFWNYGLKNKNFSLEEVGIDKLEIGDIVQFYNTRTKRYYHNVIITKIIYPIRLDHILVTSHDNNAYNKSLIEYNNSFYRFGKVS